MYNLKINARGIGKTKEAINIMLELLNQHPEKNTVTILVNKRNSTPYIEALKEHGFQYNILEQDDTKVVVKCRK